MIPETVPLLLQRCLREYDRILSTYTNGLTRSQLVLMEAVAAEPKAQKELMKITGIDRSTVSEMVRRLTASGLLTQTRGTKDRRVTFVDTTPLGRRRMKDVRVAAMLAEDELLKPIESDKDRLSFLLTRTIEHQQPKRPRLRVRHKRYLYS
jgi:DNA-binding MarR family transcriptional regulator